MMLLLQGISVFIFCITVVSSTRHLPSVETIYRNNGMTHQPDTPGLSCPQKAPMMFAMCKELFDRPHYRYQLKVYLSQQAYKNAGPPACQYLSVTFTTDLNLYPENWSENMFPCYGRHTPTRTSWDKDDYFATFYLAHTRDRTKYYVFRATKIYNSFRLNLYEEISNMPNPIPHHRMDKALAFREEMLLSVETINPWTTEIESMFVREIIDAEEQLDDQLQSLTTIQLTNFCVFLLTSVPSGREKFVIDVAHMNNWSGNAEIIYLYFQHETDYPMFQQNVYPCYEMNTQSSSGAASNYYRISSGPRKNSIIAYSMESGNYLAKYSFENLDFSGFQPPAIEAGRAGTSRND